MSSQSRRDFDELDPATLRRLDLPATSGSRRGLADLVLVKHLNLVYVTNDPARIPHAVDVRPASDITAAGARFTAPENAIRVFFNWRMTITTTATAGLRSIDVMRKDKNGNVIDHYLNLGPGASTSLIGRSVGLHSGSSIVLQHPTSLSPEWYLSVDDNLDVDNGDDVSWTIDYLEVPL